MTAYQIVTLAFYACLTAFAVAATWRSDAKRQVGLMLAMSWVASNAIFLFADFSVRVGLFPILDVLFCLSVMSAWRLSESRTTIPVALVGLSTISVAASVATAFRILDGVGYYHIHFHEIVSNAVFALQCLIVGGWGAADAVGSDFHNRLGHLRGHSRRFAGSKDQT